MMTEARPAVRPSAKAPEAAAGMLWFSLAFSAAPGAAAVVGASEECWTHIGQAALTAAGLHEFTAGDVRATYRQILTQAADEFARSLAKRLGRAVISHQPEEAQTAEAAEMAAIEISLDGTAPRDFCLGWNGSLNAALNVTAVAMRTERPPSRTLDLLMEVELPVSVSFGRAELPLRDVLKLNSGSIVELNRTISDPVEIIVNNCVIARGEVVVVDGNYGVRIQQVISREERLRTLK
jgi:flagellar motor switch protein FliN/FliY